MKKVMVFGTFDLLHEGHKDMFEQAREFGDYLIVVLARDASVKKIKGITPHQNELERLDHVKKYVDRAVLGYEDDFFRVIEENRPAVLCFGYDQNQFGAERELEKRKIKVEMHTLKAFKPDEFKSSIARKKLLENA
jgi:FAD synthetase